MNRRTVVLSLGSIVAAWPSCSRAQSLPRHAPQGLTWKDIPNIVLTVQPQRAQPLTMGQKIADVLDNGISHEYDLQLDSGTEVNIAIWFASPTANHVGHNVAVLDPSGHNADSVCRRDKMFAGDTNIAFNCAINQSGTWKVRIFGIDGDSTGAYFVTADRQ